MSPVVRQSAGQSTRAASSAAADTATTTYSAPSTSYVPPVESASPSTRSASSAATSRYSRASTDAFGDYLRRIGKGPLLSAADEVELARQIEVGLFAEEKLERAKADGVEVEPSFKRELTCLVFEGRRAKNHFIEANLRLVVSIAKHYSGRGVPIMDLVQDGNIGLVRAVEKYDFMTGFKFSTYATWWIRQAIHRGMADKSRMIRIPVHTAEKLNKIKRIRRDLSSTLDREPTL
jgi:RNA polymerase primary sigma factor